MTVCVFCRRRVFRTRNGAWYHNHNASVSCRPGWASRKASPLVVDSPAGAR